MIFNMGLFVKSLGVPGKNNPMDQAQGAGGVEG